MPRLNQQRMRTLLDCLGEVYALHDLEGFTRVALVQCRRLVTSDYGVCDEINLRAQRHRWLVEPANVTLDGPEEGHAIYFREHPLVQHLRRTGDVPPLRISDFLTQRQYHETALYREVYRAFGVEQQLGFTLPAPSPSLSVAFAFNRRCGRFSEEDRLAFSLLRRHLFRAYRNAELVSGLLAQQRQLAEALETSARGLVTLDARGRTRFSTDNARRWLEDWFGRGALAQGRLPEAVRRWFHRQQMPGTRRGSLPPPPQPFALERAGVRLTITRLAGAKAGEQVLLLQEHRTDLNAASLRRLGLTNRQAEVLVWVAQGKTNPEIGQILGLSARTVHKHTEHIFSRLGVETRTAAARTAFEVLAEDGG